MGTLLWTPVIILVLTSSASGLNCIFGLDKILSGTCEITTVDPGNCSHIDGVLLPSLCICAPGFFGTKCKATIITIPDIFCGNGGTTDKVSCICNDILINSCKMIVVGPGTTISPSLTPSSTSTPTSIFMDISSTGMTTHITTTDITSELSSESTSTDSPTGKTTSVSPEPPTASTTSVSPEPPTISTSISPEPPTASTTSVSPEPPTASTTSVSPEPPTASTTSVSPELPTISITSISPEPPTASTTSVSPEPPTASTTSVSPEPPIASTTSVSAEPPTASTTSVSPEPPTTLTTSVLPEPSTSPFTGLSASNPTELTSTGLTEVTNLTSSGSMSTLDSPTTDPALCPKHLYGKDCEFIYSEIRIDLVIIKLVISIHIEKEYNSSLTDASSSYYQYLKGIFLSEMTNIYKTLLPRLKEIKIVSFREGSVVVNHEALLEVDYRNSRKEAAQAEDRLRDYLNNLNCTSREPDWLCFNVKNTVKTEDINDSDLCSKEESISQVIKPYFSGVNMSTYLLCVTECSAKHQSPINCKWGQCSINNKGPRCYCDTSDEYWYTGDRCQTPVSKPGVIGGVVVGLIVLVAIILLLVICLCCRHSASKDLPVDTNPPWYQHGWERDIKDQGRLRNPETDNIMFGPRGPFHTTLETVNPEARMSLPRPQKTS